MSRIFETLPSRDSEASEKDEDEWEQLQQRVDLFEIHLNGKILLIYLFSLSFKSNNMKLINFQLLNYFAVMIFLIQFLFLKKYLKMKKPKNQQ